MKKTACVMVFLLSTLTAQAVLVDNFESYTPGATVSPWVVTQGAPTIGQETGGNRYLESYGSYLPLGSNSIPDTDTATTAFFRMYKIAGSSPDCSIGLSHLAAPTGDWTNFEAYVVLLGSSLQARNNTANTTIMTTISDATWYNVWLVLNNSANTYDVYVTTGSAGATASDKKASNYGFRNKLGALVTFKVYGRSANGPTRIDDIHITNGTSLSIPSGTPLPAVVVSNPTNVSVHEGQNASFQTVFTSGTAPTAAWYKVSSPADVLMDPADVILTYNESTLQYTSTLSLTGLTMSDNGQYYCQINNTSGYSRNSSTAALSVRGLIAHWTLDQADFVSGQYHDVIGGYNATAQGTPIFTAGADGSANGAVQITSASGWATVNLNPSTTGQMTVSVWAYWQETSVSSDALQVKSMPDENAVTVDSGLKSNDHWQQICAVFDGTTGKVYVDGKLRAQGTCPLPADMTSLLNIGFADSGGESFNGALDDLRIYNYAMTDTEVADVYHAMSGLGVCLLGYASQFDYTGPSGQPDCMVDLYDLVFFANKWLVLYDYPEFADLSKNWLSCGLYPNCNP
jgi:hypothetical protein